MDRENHLQCGGSVIHIRAAKQTRRLSLKSKASSKPRDGVKHARLLKQRNSTINTRLLCPFSTGLRVYIISSEFVVYRSRVFFDGMTDCGGHRSGVRLRRGGRPVLPGSAYVTLWVCLFGRIRRRKNKNPQYQYQYQIHGALDLRGRGVEILARKREREAKTLVNSELDRCLERSNFEMFF